MNGVTSLSFLLVTVALTNARTIYEYGAVADWVRHRPMVDIIPSTQNPNSPHIQPRHRRSPEKTATVTGTVKVPLIVSGPERTPKVAVDVQKNLYDGPYGTVGVYAGAGKSPHQNPEAQVGIRGTIRFGGFDNRKEYEIYMERKRLQID